MMIAPMMKNTDFNSVSSDGPAAKKPRQDRMDATSLEPSPVIVVRNLSERASEADLLEAMHHFGTIGYTYIHQKFKYGLVEFEDVTSAAACIQYARNSAIYVAGSVASFAYAAIKQVDRIGFQSANPSNILIIVINNIQHQVNVDVVHSICIPHGNVLRISLIRKRVIQALVEFDSVVSARNAKHQLNGADIYEGSCTLKVDFAKVDTVRVRQNDSDNWDYTQGNTVGQNAPTMPARKILLSSPGKPVVGGIAMGKVAGGLVPQVGMAGYGGDPYGVRPSYSDGIMPAPGGLAMDKPAPFVLMLYGIDQQNWNCEKIFNLLCLYGNVNKIKMLHSKPDTAMVEMSDERGGNNAVNMLRNLQLFEKDVELKPSRTVRLAAPKGESNDLFKDFEQDVRNRFTTTEKAAKNHIVTPSKKLHWFNVPPTMNEQWITKIFTDSFVPTPTRITINPNPKSNKSSSGTVLFDTVCEATEAMIKVNHINVFAEGKETPYVMKLAFENERLRRGDVQKEINVE